MRNRTKQTSSLVILAGAAALAGCASVQSTDEFAASHGYVHVKLQGRQYYCHPQQAEVPSPDPSQMKWTCLTRVQLQQVRLAGAPPSPPAYFFSSPPATPSMAGNSLPSDMPRYYGTYQR